MSGRFVIALAVLAGAFGGPNPALAQQGPHAFHFAAFGDMPYNPPGDYEKVDRLIARINADKPAFAIHIGDMISGSIACSNEILERSARQLEALEAPLVYTPGDNEWTDCHRARGGGFDPLERLAKVRALMFPNPGRTLGKMQMSVESQGLVMKERFAPYVENVRFSKNGVQFATLHVVGSNNNLDEDRPGAAEEFRARDAANAAWIEHAFAAARQEDSKAVVLAWQANVHHRGRKDNDYSPAFAQTVSSVAKQAKEFGRPVLVIYGDYHFFEISRFLDMDGKPAPHVTRLQVYGDKHVHAVRVNVDPDSPGVFSFAPLIAPENGLP